MTPADTAVARRLLAHAKTRGWEGVLLQPGEHEWEGPALCGAVYVSTEKVVAEGPTGVVKGECLTSGQQVIDLLAAAGLVPLEMTSGWLLHRDQLAARLDQLCSAYIDTQTTIPLPAEEAINHA